MQSASLDILYDAIARNCGAVLSLPSAGMLRHHKSRFLASAAGGFWLESAPGERPLIDELVSTRRPVGVSFKSGATKAVFTVPLLRREPQFRVNAETIVESLFLAFPSDVKAIQRRTNYRVALPAGCDLSGRVWRVSEQALLKDRPMDAQEIACEIRDISVGGMGVIFRGADGGTPKVGPDDRLRVQLRYEDISLLLEGCMRQPSGPPSPDGSLRTGVQFKALESDLEGRQMLAQLTRIVGDLQRAEVRRFRLGIA